MCTNVYPVVLDLGLHWIMHKGIYVSQRQHLHTSLIKSNAPYRSDTRKEKTQNNRIATQGVKWPNIIQFDSGHHFDNSSV